jgi:hypothetical protein
LRISEVGNSILKRMKSTGLMNFFVYSDFLLVETAGQVTLYSIIFTRATRSAYGNVSPRLWKKVKHMT